jgi:phosphoglycolate phosphatase
MMTRRPTLVLFDIDGTLILSGRAGVRGMNLAFSRLYGREKALDGVAIAGRTDRAIVIDAMRGIGQDPTEAAIHRLRDAYFEHLRVELGRAVTDPSGVLPGVASLLDALESQAHVAVGLLTGNFEGGAAIKLGHFDLWHRFPFGAFGDEHVDRRALVAVAVHRAKAGLHHVGAPDRIIVIGDTPLDVDCAQASGAVAVAVATGPFDRAALAATDPDLLVDSLAELDAVLRVVADP